MPARRPAAGPSGERAAVAAAYRRFAAVEAAGRSPVYAAVAEHVGRDPAALDFLLALPGPKRRPSLLFGAIQYLAGPLTGPDAFDAALARRSADVTRVMLTRSVQTNIPARCATLLPVLAALPQPLSLIEVGASAGLCLYPDRCTYDYDGHVIAPDGPPHGPRLRCSASRGTPLPTRPVEVVRRTGLDLDPLDVTDDDHRAWLEALVWPGEEHLRDQLRAAVEVARADPPHLVAGDLATDLPPLLVAAHADAATTVVLHSAVLTYVTDPERRQRFADTVLASGAVWIANESPTVIPGVPADVVATHPAGQFLLCRDGRPLARTDPHGARLTWVADR